MSKCIKCGRELTSGEIPEFNYGMCDKCYKDYQCKQYPFKKGIFDMQDEIKQLKQQLEEKGKEIEQLKQEKKNAGEEKTRAYLDTLTKPKIIELCLQYINDKNIAEQQLEALMLEISKQEVEQHDLPDYCTRTGTDCINLGKIEELQQQLAEKDIRIEELEGQFAYECECNKQLVELQKQLEEKQNTIDEINKEFVQAVHDWKALCAEKDKEIEKLKQQYTILENENGKLTTELIMDKYKKAQKEVSFGKQLAIQELKKVKVNLKDRISMMKNEEHSYLQKVVAWYDICDQINNQIKQLKEGE